MNQSAVGSRDVDTLLLTLSLHFIPVQVVEETMLILKEFGYNFERRGLVKVKGKGDLMTYFLLGKDSDVALPNQVQTV